MRADRQLGWSTAVRNLLALGPEDLENNKGQLSAIALVCVLFELK